MTSVSNPTLDEAATSHLGRVARIQANAPDASSNHWIIQNITVGNNSSFSINCSHGAHFNLAAVPTRAFSADQASIDSFYTADGGTETEADLEPSAHHRLRYISEEFQALVHDSDARAHIHACLDCRGLLDSFAFRGLRGVHLSTSSTARTMGLNPSSESLAVATTSGGDSLYLTMTTLLSQLNANTSSAFTALDGNTSHLSLSRSSLDTGVTSIIGLTFTPENSASVPFPTSTVDSFSNDREIQPVITHSAGFVLPSLIVVSFLEMGAKPLDIFDAAKQNRKAMKYYQDALNFLENWGQYLSSEKMLYFTRMSQDLSQDILKMESVTNTAIGRFLYWKEARKVKRRLRAYLWSIKYTGILATQTTETETDTDDAVLEL